MNNVKLLPSDVWVEILRRIPAADLVPLKAVCKTFHRVISSDFFARLHLEYFTKAKRAMIITMTSATDHATLFHSNYYDPDKSRITVWCDEPRFDDWCSHHVFPHDKYRHWVIDSYCGILLLQIRDRLLLCNPITKSYKFLPSLSQVRCWKIGGYDDIVSKQYKVFGLTKIKNEFSLCVFDVHRELGELHSHRKTKNVKLEERSLKILMESVLVNGSVYWLIIARRAQAKTYILSVNVSTEEVQTRSCSSILTHNYDQFFAANGTFYLANPSHIYCSYLQLCVLEGLESENPNPSWMIKNRIEKSHLSSFLKSSDWCIEGFFRDKMLIAVTPSCENQLYQYDLGNEEIEKVTSTMDDNNERGVDNFMYFCIVEHIDSLLSLGPINDEVLV